MNPQPHQQWVSTDTFSRTAVSSRKRSAYNVPYASGILSLLSTATVIVLIPAMLVIAALYFVRVWEHAPVNSWGQVVQRPLAIESQNFAEISTGAQVIMSLTSRSIAVEKLPWYGQLVLSLCSGRDFDGSQQLASAQLVFRERDERDGTCWMFAGEHGFIAVWLADATIPNSVVIHQPISHQRTARTIAQAPRHVVIWGLVQFEHSGETSAEQAWDRSEHIVVERFATRRYLTDLPRSISRDTPLVKMGEFEFLENSGMSRQVFPLDAREFVSMIVVEIMDNWGAARTCVHRISVH